MPMKNKPVGTHSVDMLLSCGHIEIKPVEAVVFLSVEYPIGKQVTCSTCGKVVFIQKVGTPFWNDVDTK